MEKFECKCIKIPKILLSFKIGKYYLCEYLDTKLTTYFLRVYCGEIFVYFDSEEKFSVYFDYNKYLRLKKLQKLNESNL